jgi:lipid-A-disaccharide synthase
MKPRRPLRIALIAGEDSGDLLGANLIHGLRELHPGCEIRAVAGPRMRQQGVEVIHPSEDFAVMGLTEVLRHLPRLLRLRRKIVREISAFAPDVVVGIDAPDLNLPIEARLKARGIKTVHYVSPSVWAWRGGRAEKMAANTDAVLTLFPFEPPWYTRHGGQARFVGHPLASQLPVELDKKAEKMAAGLAPEQLVVALLPGSRWHEIRALSDDFVQAAVRVQQARPEVVFVSANTHPEKRQWFANAAKAAGIRLQEMDSASQALRAADGALLASGTVALEALLCKTPMVVAYRLSRVTHALVKGLKLMQQPWYSLPNVLEGDFLVPEIMQQAISPEALANAMLAQFDVARRQHLVDRFTHHHWALLPPSEHAAARAVLEVVGC